ncbi:MFS general substrate transporter [Myriangium duriaei CBS 260.36]|uniref:MFS general substrate transporter n=1 Tax=Myriangium duriaei CBS 260.36 TaxID=1168546 RepID=A0A9P4J3F3_9PEZI|nr:MFS general substrate transporter [Myriangium duriaei CBS 260.36]
MQPEDLEHNKEKIEADLTNVDENLVTFFEPFDSQNPKQWSTRKKWLVTSVMSATAFIRITSSTIMAPALGVISEDLRMNSIESSMALSVYLLASAFGPLVLSPLSELYGRKPVLHCSNTWFLIWNLLCGFSHTKGMLIGSRALAGFGGSVAYALGSAVLGDIWRPEERGRSFAIYFLIPLLGAAIGPTVGGYITQYASWQWIFWSLSAVHAGLVVFSFLAFSESHPATILRHRARHLRKTTRNQNLFTLAERLEEGQTVIEVLIRSLTRPIRLLAFHPIVQLIAVIEGFTYGILYLVLSSFADLWTKEYHESIATSGLHYFAYAIGEILAAQIGAPFMDYVFRKLKARRNGEVSPEFRVPLMLPGIILTPIGFLIYGWTAKFHAHWAIVDLGVVIQACGLQLVDQPLTAYIIDSYPDHASSATAASQLLRSLAAFSFPLFAPRMFAALGYGWGNSTLALAVVVLCGPAPLILWKFGPRLRMKAQSSH